MCELATLSIAATVASGAVSALGALQQGAANEQAARYQAQVARNNEIIAERAAEDAERRGEMEAQEVRARGRRLQARQRAVLAGAGQDVGVGSAVDIVSDTAEFAELDALTVRSNAAREALGLRTDAMNFSARSQLLDATAANARTSSFLEAGGSLLSSGGQVASKWYNFRREGAFGG